jgi:hypothetical protein
MLSLCQSLSNTLIKHLDLFQILHALMCPCQAFEQGSLINQALKQITTDLFQTLCPLLRFGKHPPQAFESCHNT